MSRTPQDVFDAHFAAVARGDVDAVLADYSTDAVVMTVDTVLQGHEAIRSFFTAALGWCRSHASAWTPPSLRETRCW
jgi:ketosteroid isomerase-like protein